MNDEIYIAPIGSTMMFVFSDDLSNDVPWKLAEIANSILANSAR